MYEVKVHWQTTAVLDKRCSVVRSGSRNAEDDGLVRG